MANIRFKELISHLGKTINRPDLAPDDYGIVTLSLHDIIVSLEEVPKYDLILVYADLGELPTHGREKFMHDALKANWLFLGAFSAALAINPETEKLAINQYCPISIMTEKLFEDFLTNFLSKAIDWHNLLQKFRDSSQEGQLLNVAEMAPPPVMTTSDANGSMLRFLQNRV